MTLNKIRLIRAAAADQGVAMGHVVFKETCKPIHIILTNRMDSTAKKNLIEGVEKIKFTGIDYYLESDICQSKEIAY